MVADDLSRRVKCLGVLAYLPAAERPLELDVQALASQERQHDEPHLLVLQDRVLRGDARDVTIGDDEVLRMQGRICVPNVDGLRELILEEAYGSRYSIQSGAAKMYHDLRQHYWWRRIKKDIVGFVARCLNCQQFRQKSYADRKVRDVSYVVGEMVLLKVSPMKGVIRFGKRDKLSP
ncbi:uncharacterized protein [Nicotiana tomentosiformis]|uniref:uncharacterized protein n=1 Tax=Nicotiana tomentosiformis TaxID=4098 RepID=UPI00388C5152